METPSPSTELVTAAYTIPADTKAKIEQIARDEDLNASQVVRRILAEYFGKRITKSPRKTQTA